MRLSFGKKEKGGYDCQIHLGQTALNEIKLASTVLIYVAILQHTCTVQHSLIMCIRLLNSHFQKIFVVFLIALFVIQIDNVFLKNGMCLILQCPSHVKHIVGIQ